MKIKKYEIKTEDGKKHVLELPENDPRNELIKEFMDSEVRQKLMGDYKDKVNQPMTGSNEFHVGGGNRVTKGNARQPVTKDLQKAFEYFCEWKKRQYAEPEGRAINITFNVCNKAVGNEEDKSEMSVDEIPKDTQEMLKKAKIPREKWATYYSKYHKEDDGNGKKAKG